MAETQKNNILLKKIGIILMNGFLSSFIGELLLSKMDLISYFHPIRFFLIFCTYTLGIVIIHEYSLLKQKGYFGFILFSLIFSIIKDGLIIESFINSDPYIYAFYFDITFGRWIGINWIWMIFSIIFDTSFSLMIPFIISEILFPTYWKAQWFNIKVLKGVGIAFVIISFIFIDVILRDLPEDLQNSSQLLGFLIIIVLFIVLSHSVPDTSLKDKDDLYDTSSIKYFLLGLLTSISLLIPLWITHLINFHPIFISLWLIGWACLYYWRFYHNLSIFWLNALQRYDLILGLLFIPIAMGLNDSLFRELNFQLMIVDIILAVFLISIRFLLKLKIKRNIKTQK